MDSFDSGLDTRSVNFLPFLAFFKLDQIGLERSASWIWGTGIGVWGTCNLWRSYLYQILISLNPILFKDESYMLGCWWSLFVYVFVNVVYFCIAMNQSGNPSIHPITFDIYRYIWTPCFWQIYHKLGRWSTLSLLVSNCPHISVFVIGFMWTCLFVHIKWLYSSLLSVCNCVPFTRCINRLCLTCSCND